MLLDAASWHGSSHLLLLLLHDDDSTALVFEKPTDRTRDRRGESKVGVG